MKKLTTILLALFLLAGTTYAQCPIPPGTSYHNAPLVLQCDLDGFFGTLFPPGIGGNETPPSWFVNCGIVDNSHWFAFLPTALQTNFTIEVSNCNMGQGMQGIIYGIDNNSCDINALYDVSNCYSQDIGMADFTLVGNNFVQGEVYYLLLDGWDGDICDYNISIQDVVPFPPLPAPSLNGPSPVTYNSTHTYTLDFPGRPDLQNPCNNSLQFVCGCSTCEYDYIAPTNVTVTVPPGATYTITNSYEIEVTFGEESGEVCITFDGSCGTSTYCKYVEVVPVCFNNPAPPGDSCINAPLFCAEFLDDFCSTTAGLTADTPGNLNSLLSCAVENNAWIRITPCEEDISLAFEVGDCRDFVGLEISLFSTENCDTFNLIKDCTPVSHGHTDTLTFTGLTSGGTYYLLIDGVNGDECSFAIDLVDGFYLPDTISPPPPPVIDPWKITQVSLAYIEGPECICSGEPATYIYHDAVCIIEQGDCGPIVMDNFNSTSSCLPQEACQNNRPWLVKVDRFPVWHIPEGATFDGDSTGYTVDVNFDPLAPCKDSVYSDVFFRVDTACGMPPLPMIPTNGSGTFVDTSFTDTIVQTVWVEIGCTYMLPDSSLVTWIPSENMGGIPDSFYWRNQNSTLENVYCPCNPNSFSICGICIEGASLDTDVKIKYDYDTETICDPECFDFAGYSLCDGGQYWLKQTCGYQILNLNIDEPETFDLGMHYLCPWDCFHLPANNQLYCNPGVYDIIVVDPISGCEDHYLFELYFEPDEWFNIVNVVEECISPDNDFYTVSFEIIGANNWGGYFVNNQFISGPAYTSAPIASGDSYSFSIQSAGPCPEFQSVSGSHTCLCVPETNDLGLFELCPGDCFNLPQNGQDYCVPGNYDIIIPNPATNCDDHYLFEVRLFNPDVISVSTITESCSVDNLFYTVTFEVNGTPPFLINGQPHAGGPFTSDPIASGDSYSFNLESTGPCPELDVVSGSFTCTCTPVTTDLGLFEVCPGDCFTLPQNGQDYCNAGNYDIIVLNPVDNCEDHFLFEIVNLNPDVVDIANLVENCSTDNNFYTVTFDVNGTAPFFVNGQPHAGGTFISDPITSGDPYSFMVESSGACPQSTTVSGLLSCTCTPVTTNLGLFELCPGDCYTLPQNGQNYCTAGNYDIIVLNPVDNCEDHFLFEIVSLNPDVVDIANVMETCTANNNFYSISFEVSGTGPFLINGQSHPGGIFTSNPIPSGDPYSFTVESTGPCPQSNTTSGSFTCICTPVTTDLGLFQLCPGDCFTLPQNGQDYCIAGNYDIIVLNPVDNCEDHFLFEIVSLNTDVVDIANVVENCSTDNNFYTVTFDVNGTGPFLVNGQSHTGGPFVSDLIPSGDPYSFTVESTGPCPQSSTISGSFTCPCTPLITDLGLFQLCPGDCFTLPQNLEDYCTAGSYDIIVINAIDNCEDHYLFQLEVLNTDIIDITNVVENCSADNSSYTVSFEINGTAPFLVEGQPHPGGTYTSNPIVSGDPYSFTVESTGSCPATETISGSFTCPNCVPAVIELGTMDLCTGECFPYNGTTYCTPGLTEVEILNAEGCIDTHRFTLNFVNASTPSTSTPTELCDATFSTYTVSFTIQGTPPFLVNGNPPSGSVDFFQSNPILSGSSYLFEVEHSGPCAEPIIIQGTFSCQAACSNSAGSLRDNFDYLCETQEVQVTHNDNEVLGTDDLLEFILFLGADPMSGQILERNTNGIFAFNSNFMSFGTPYQIIAVVGNQVGGEVNLQDNCLDISNQVTVTFYELPVLLTGQTDDKILTCKEPEINLSTSVGGGSGQWRYLWIGNGISSDSTSISVQTPGVYYFTATDLVTGCNTIDSVKVLENKVFPIIAVQPVLALDCATDRVLLDASNSEQGPPFEFTWSTTSGQFSNPPNTLLPEVTAAGTYILEITNTTSGCVSERAIEVTDLEDELTLVDLEIQQLLCNGNNNATINIQDVIGGNPGYQYTFDGFDYGDQGRFENLEVGNYELHIEDSKGCTLDTLIVITEPDAMDLGLEETYVVIMGEPFQVAVNPNFELNSIEWTNPNGEIISSAIELNTFFSRTTTLYIEATDINGCQINEQISISVPESNNLVFIPSAFSPNNDFNNDRLELFTHPSVALIQSFKVYSRWGDLVHGCENVQPDPGGSSACSWDGQLRGRSLDPAVFVYILEIKLINGTEKVLTGDVMIIR